MESVKELSDVRLVEGLNKKVEDYKLAFPNLCREISELVERFELQRMELEELKR